MSEENLTFHDCPIVLSVGSGIEKQERNEQKNEATCIICKFWIGRCLKEHVGKIASSDACESFERRE